MLSCYHNGELFYINKLEDFRDVMEDSVFEAVKSFIDDEVFRRVEDRDTSLLYENAELEEEIDDLNDEVDNYWEQVKEKSKELEDLKGELRYLTITNGQYAKDELVHEIRKLL